MPSELPGVCQHQLVSSVGRCGEALVRGHMPFLFCLQEAKIRSLKHSQIVAVEAATRCKASGTQGCQLLVWRCFAERSHTWLTLSWEQAADI